MHRNTLSIAYSFIHLGYYISGANLIIIRSRVKKESILEQMRGNVSVILTLNGYSALQ